MPPFSNLKLSVLCARCGNLRCSRPARLYRLVANTKTSFMFFTPLAPSLDLRMLQSTSGSFTPMLNQFGLRCDPGIHINQGLSSELASKELRHVQRPELDCLYMYCHTASYYTRIIYYTRLYISPTLLPLSMIPNHSLLLLLLVLVIRPLLHPVDRLLPRKLPLLPPHGLGLLLLHHHPFPL